MFKYTLLFISILILLIVNINAQYGSIDLSDDNEVVYCLKAARHYTMEQVKEYYFKIQLPKYANEKYIDDPAFSWCVESVARDD